MDEFKHLKSLDDDTLYNILQQVRVDLFCAGNVESNRAIKLRSKLEFIHEILEERGLNAHKQF